MANIASPVALVSYNPVSDSAVIVYEIPVAVNKVSLLARTIGTSDNAKVTINKSGLLDAVNVLEKAGVVNYLATQAGATANGLLVAGAGFVTATATAAGANQAAVSTTQTKDLIIVTTAASADLGIKLPVITPLRTIRIINNTSYAIIVYATVNDFMGTEALTATGVSVPIGSSLVVWSKSDAVTNTATARWQILQS